MTSSFVDLIARKRDRGELTPGEIRDLIPAYLAGEVDDAQMAALLMAGLLNGFTDAEAGALTQALVDSGRSIDLSTLRGPTIDKHSTGGVGDATTLIVGPLLAAAGCQVAKLSGRGLGHTGGTIDKLESIPGLRVELTTEQLLDQVARVGVAVASAGDDLAPADKRLYALRDVTATVEDPALIASSVMSKKLAGGAAHILLDVKVGAGAFMPDLQQATALAERCVAIGTQHGRRTAAVLTQMDDPLADAIGNALEVAEAIEVLAGRRDGPLRDLSVEVAASALALTGQDLADSRVMMSQLLGSTRLEGVFRDLIAAQGGPSGLFDDHWQYLPRAPVVQDWSSEPGVVQRIDARRLGEIARRLGAGRQRLGDQIDPAVGLEILVRTGDRVEPGAPVVRVHARTEGAAADALAHLPSAIEVADRARGPLPLLLGSVGLSDAAGGV